MYIDRYIGHTDHPQYVSPHPLCAVPETEITSQSHVGKVLTDHWLID